MRFYVSTSCFIDNKTFSPFRFSPWFKNMNVSTSTKFKHDRGVLFAFFQTTGVVSDSASVKKNQRETTKRKLLTGNRVKARKIINNYWTRLSKISWFVRGKQINYLPKPEAEANNWSARLGQITTFCDNRVQFIIRSQFFFPIFSIVWFELRTSRLLFAASTFKRYWYWYWADHDLQAVI